MYIFRCMKFDGKPQETEEMKAVWFNNSALPYQEMWADDKYWMPLFLQGKKFRGRFLFDEKDQVVDYNLRMVDRL